MFYLYCNLCPLKNRLVPRKYTSKKNEGPNFMTGLYSDRKKKIILLCKVLYTFPLFSSHYSYILNDSMYNNFSTYLFMHYFRKLFCHFSVVGLHFFLIFQLIFLYQSFIYTQSMPTGFNKLPDLEKIRKFLNRNPEDWFKMSA